MSERIQRDLERGDFKQALKDARVGYRQQPTPELRSLLEHAYAGRAQQLVRQGLRDDARRILGQLLDLGASEPAVESALPELLLSVGMLDQLVQRDGALQTGEREPLRLRMVDQAVLRPEEAPKAMPELREGALQIRAALSALERGDESESAASLRGIARRSPFADWKYFVRGLAAYYRGDSSDMLANWDRLDPDRVAVRIAEPLKVIAGVMPGRKDRTLQSRLRRLEKATSNHAVLTQLTALGSPVAERDWPRVLKVLRNLREPLRSLDGGLQQRLVTWLSSKIIHEGLIDELEHLARVADAPPIDPHWNRSRALVRECSDEWPGIDAAVYWQKYVIDLQNAPSLVPAERDLARGLVCEHLAQHHVADSMKWRNCPCGADHARRVAAAEAKALEAFQQCFQLLPAYAAAYENLAKYYRATDRPDDAAQVYRQLLEHVPDHLEAVVFLGNHYTASDQPLEARRFAERARQLKPLDRKVVDLLWTTHLASSRHWACRGQYQKACDELAAADELMPSRASDTRMLARKAALAIKMADEKASREYVDRAVERLPEPTAFWLMMAIEATRYDLPTDALWLYEKRWRDALKRRCQSHTAGLMCRTMCAELKAPTPHGNWSEYVEILREYVRRCSRVKWCEEDLREVCRFLYERREFELLEKFAKKACKTFPDVAEFHFLAGSAEMAKGPFCCDRELAEEHFQEAICLGPRSNHSKDKESAEAAKQTLSLVRILMADDEDEYEYDEDEDEDESDIDETGATIDELYNVFRAACRQRGLDPEQLIEDVRREISERSRGN